MPTMFGGGGGLTAPVAATDIADGSVSNTEFQYLNNVTSAIQTQLDGKLNDTGDTITGDLLLSGAVIKGAAANDTIIDAQSGRVVAVRVNGTTYVDVRNNSTFATTRFFDSSGANAVTLISSSGAVWDTSSSGHSHIFRIAGTQKGQITNNGFVPGAGSTPGNENIINLQTYLNFACSNGYFGHAFYYNGTNYTTIGPSGLQFPAGHSAPATSVHGVWRDGTGTILQGPTTGYTYVGTNGLAAPLIGTSGTGASVVPGAVWLYPAAVSLAAAATRTVASSATTKSGSVEIMNTTDGKRATFSVENGTPVKIEGDASFVAGAPGASQIGLELSSTTLRINNGYAGAKLIAFIVRLA